MCGNEREIRELFTRLLAQEPAPAAAETIGAPATSLAKRSTHVDYGLSKIAIHAWAESPRRPEPAAGTRDFYRDLRVLLTELVQRWQDAGALAPDAGSEAAATVLLTVMPGMAVSTSSPPCPRAEAFPDNVRRRHRRACGVLEEFGTPALSLGPCCADLAVEATGNQVGSDAAVPVLGVVGRLVCCGHNPGMEFGPESTGMAGQELSVAGSRHSTPADAIAGLAAVERGDVRPRIDSLPDLDPAGVAFGRRASPQAMGRVVVTMWPQARQVSLLPPLKVSMSVSAASWSMGAPGGAPSSSA
ncbi:TetR family transcriptional regulator C-terminal domain-containing protein [Streptomyces prunicolor]|uniref:TetR family transcriptional regulator C-terminal domain-containing protein n=1 Tax=Streptomyces prunicolor TaxID=67348 RepID=UPI0033F0F73C